MSFSSTSNITSTTRKGNIKLAIDVDNLPLIRRQIKLA